MAVKKTQAIGISNALEALSRLSKADMAALSDLLSGGSPKETPKKKATIRVVVNEGEERKFGLVSIWKIKGSFEEPVVGIRDHEDLVGLIEELQVAELETRPEDDS